MNERERVHDYFDDVIPPPGWDRQPRFMMWLDEERRRLRSGPSTTRATRPGLKLTDAGSARERL